MPLIRDPFEPAPESSVVLDSILDYPIEPGDQADDHEDIGELSRPPLLTRIASRLRHGKTDGE